MNKQRDFFLVMSRMKNGFQHGASKDPVEFYLADKMLQEKGSSI